MQHGSILINSNSLPDHEPRCAMRDLGRPGPLRRASSASARRARARAIFGLIFIAKAEPGMYEASAPHGQALPPPFLGFGGSIVVQGYGQKIAIRGAALALGRPEELRLPAAPSRLAAGTTPPDCLAARAGSIRRWESGVRRTPPSIRRANRAGGPDSANTGLPDVYPFSRFFPSIPRYELYKLWPDASARPYMGDVASQSSQPHCGHLLSSPPDA